MKEAKQAGHSNISGNVALVCARSIFTHLLQMRNRCRFGTHRVVGEVRVTVITVKPERGKLLLLRNPAALCGPRRTGARGSAAQDTRRLPRLPRPEQTNPPRAPTRPHSLGHGAPRRPRRQEVTPSRNDAFRRLGQGGAGPEPPRLAPKGLPGLEKGELRRTRPFGLKAPAGLVPAGLAPLCLHSAT